MTRKRAVMRYAGFVRECYVIIIISTLLIAIAVGRVPSTPGRFLQQYSVLFIVIMIGAMGFSITFKSLSASLKEWCARCLSLGLVLNFLFAPLLCSAMHSCFSRNIQILPLASSSSAQFPVPGWPWYGPDC